MLGTYFRTTYRSQLRRGRSRGEEGNEVGGNNEASFPPRTFGGSALRAFRDFVAAVSRLQQCSGIEWGGEVSVTNMGGNLDGGDTREM